MIDPMNRSTYAAGHGERGAVRTSSILMALACSSNQRRRDRDPGGDLETPGSKERVADLWPSAPPSGVPSPQENKVRALGGDRQE
jgi:hypothetical protein